MEVFFIIFLIYLILFILSIKIKDNSILDIFWGIGFVIIASAFFMKDFNLSLEKILILILINIWGLRLFYHILKRKLKNKKEDPRYANWRIKWKYFYVRSFFQVFILQMILMFIVSFPIYFIFSGTNINSIIFIIGITTSIIGLLFEVISDNQLKNYLNKPLSKNLAFTGGLYKYSRNPNYFGESLFWLGLSIIGSSVSIYIFVGFVLITFLLLFVSGIPLKENRMKNKVNWKEYKEKTSIFIPWFNF